MSHISGEYPTFGIRDSCPRQGNRVLIYQACSASDLCVDCTKTPVLSNFGACNLGVLAPVPQRYWLFLRAETLSLLDLT
jgi:hypothetical protein